jgi:hypothetical protein
LHPISSRPCRAYTKASSRRGTTWEVYLSSLRPRGSGLSLAVKGTQGMHPKEALSRSLKWFGEHLLSAFLSICLAALIAAWGGLFQFSKSGLDYAILLLNKPTQLWVTICLIVLFCLYTYSAARRRIPQEPPNVQEDLHEVFGVYWNSQYKLRCLKCKWPLKCSSDRKDPSLFFCSSCNTKYSLRDKNGNHLTESQAIEQIKSDANQSTDHTRLAPTNRST